MRKAVLYLKDILAALDSIQAFTAGFVDGGQDYGADQ
jgi:uncharacterized protein with HEPN domain